MWGNTRRIFQNDTSTVKLSGEFPRTESMQQPERQVIIDIITITHSVMVFTKFYHDQSWRFNNDERSNWDRKFYYLIVSCQLFLKVQGCLLRQ